MTKKIAKALLSTVFLGFVCGAVVVAQQDTGESLIQKLSDSDVHVRRDAAKQIDTDPNFPFSAKAPQIFSALNDEDAEVRAWVLAAVMDRVVTDPSFSSIVLQHKNAIQKALGDSEEAVRELAAKVVFFIRPNPPEDFSEPLIRLLSDDKDSVRRSALAALTKVRPITPKINRAFLHLLADSDMKAYAAHALAEIGSNDENTVNALEGALGDESPFVKQEAVKALARIGHPAAKSLKTLEAMANDPNLDSNLKKLIELAIKVIQ